MENREKKKRNVWWPDVNDEKGLKDAINCGAGVAVWIAISYLFVSIYLFYTGEGFFSGKLTAEEQTVTTIVNIFAILLALFLSWRIWKKSGYISAIIVLVWVVIEVSVKAVEAPGKGIIVSIIMLFLAVHGVRGTLANRKVSQ